MNVESRGAGFLPSGRPKILFEGHKFSEFTGGRFDRDHPDISYRGWTREHYVGGEGEYERLERAIQLDRTAALRATSWGLGQVMGFNAEKAGYRDVEDMVAKMSESEDEQLQGMIRFIVGGGLAPLLAAGKWTSFAAAYNGARYAENQYDQKLAKAHATYLSNGVPDLSLRNLQSYLERLGFDPGRVDGLWGVHTKGAINDFLESKGLPLTNRFQPEHVALLADEVARLNA
jgi:hypothetical protein